MRTIELEDSIKDETISFLERAKRVFSYQFEHNKPYQRFCESLGVKPESITHLNDIPLYPIRGFKETVLLSDQFDINQVTYFQSSGTSTMQRSRHYLAVPEMYRWAARTFFETHYPDYPILAYLPAYEENPHSSLISMVNDLIRLRNTSLPRQKSLFLPTNQSAVTKICADFPVILFGAAFGLLDIIENQRIKLHPDSIMIETGGMKTFRKEISRQDLHQLLASGFGLEQSQVHSEYGMAELLSQAYKRGLDEPFISPDWMQISVRRPDNPFQECKMSEEGQIGVIDLANLYSCSFILTEDRGFALDARRFEVLGRLKKAELRGCNFLLERD